MRDDRHLNLFEHYMQQDAIPHENNISRVLAILFDSEPLLLDRFIRLVNGKLPSGVSAVNPPTRRGAMSIGFQQKASALAEDAGRRVLCLTLTPDKAAPAAAAPSTDDPVTDISLISEDDLLLVEVKKQTGASAGAQVLEQAKKIRGLIEKAGEKSPPEIIKPVNITWGEMIDVLEDVYDLQGKSERSPLGHYLRYLDAHCQEWFSVTPFRACTQNAKTLVRTRLQNLADNCCPLTGGAAPAGWMDGRAVVPAEFGFAREFHLSAEWAGPVFKGIKAILWLGNNGAQSRVLFSSPDVRDNMAWTNGGHLGETGAAFTVTPYLKFSHVMGHYVMEEYCQAVGTYRREIREKFAEPLNGRWEQSSWEKLKKFLTEDNPGLLKNPESFRKSFEANFENSGRNFAFVTFGYEAVIRFPVEDLIKHEALGNFTPTGDQTARWVVQAVKELKAEILK